MRKTQQRRIDMHDLFSGCSCGGHDDKTTPTMPLIGDAAPAFVAQTTNGEINFPSDFAGKWVVLFSHPGDFTPVCTSEFMAFQALSDQLAEINTELVGLSVGSVSSHLAWIDAIKNIKWREWENVEITFPVIDDVSQHVAKMYGMMHPNASGTHAVRAVFIIDPKGIIRAILYYPLTTGRNFDEILRLVVALQTTDAFHVSTPADWRPGDDVLAPAPATAGAMRDAIRNPRRTIDVRSWFFGFKKLPEADIDAKIKRGAASKKKPKNIA